MDRFDWQSRLKEVYSVFPEAENRPVIGITGNYGEETCKLGDRYYKSVIAAGGVPVIIPPASDTDVIIATLDRIDGLLLSGGGDYNPLYCGGASTVNVISPNFLSRVWLITGRYRCWAFAVAYRLWLWRWEERWRRT